MQPTPARIFVDPKNPACCRVGVAFFHELNVQRLLLNQALWAHFSRSARRTAHDPTPLSDWCCDVCEKPPFHPPANKAKMAAGIPLDDDDRAPWLAEIGAALATPGGGAGSRIIACSALKRGYRDLLRSFVPDLVFVHLSGEAATISGRLSNRAHEYMPGSLLASQLATLEPLADDEAHIVADILEEPAALVDGIVRQLELSAGQHEELTRHDELAGMPGS
ncbi:gluconokinase, GntK/IdnK-type [Burkholderia sp. RS01]|uniref:gluconokinase n=1 Tax=unclassified Burkholderia TaxID=2613784 RepID=UPI0032184364